MNNRRRSRFSRPRQSSNERWLITYADLITLLLIFFIILYTMSRVDAERFQAVAESLHKAMGSHDSILDGGGGIAPSAPSSPIEPLEEQEEESLLALKQKIEAYLSAQGLEKDVSVSLEERGVVISFQDLVLFPLGSAQLMAESSQIIQQVGDILHQVNNYVRVEGHTDSLPINTPQFPSNWELSSARSSQVVRELIASSGLEAARLSASGYAEHRPRKSNDLEENRRHNRRVDLIVLRNKFEEIEPGQDIKDIIKE